MDIAALSMALSTANLQTAVGVAVADKGQDIMKQSGAQLVEMIKGMELSVNPNVGSNINIRL